MTCIDPACKGSPVLRPEHSTCMAEMYYCPDCKLRFTTPTTLGRASQFAPSVIALCGVFGLVDIGHDIWSDGGGGWF
jgi:hypothetical protein